MYDIVSVKRRIVVLIYVVFRIVLPVVFIQFVIYWLVHLSRKECIILIECKCLL
jgi:hypothetical protein